MNKLVKGSVAAAAGIALLMGGAGSLAYWNDSATLTAGTVSSGTLDVSTSAAGSWSPSIAKIVPGDTVTYTQQLTLDATGDNLKATVTSNIASITNNITGSTATSSFVVKTAPGGVVVNPVAGVYTLNGAYTVDVTVTVAFASSTANLVGQNASVNLSTLAITVTQVP
jgi:alternate signal-mediated exported protein